MPAIKYLLYQYESYGCKDYNQEFGLLEDAKGIVNKSKLDDALTINKLFRKQ